MTAYQNLPCVLTDQEIIERAKKSARLSYEHGNLEEEKSATAKSFKERLDDLLAQINAISDEIRSGVTYRDVPVDIEQDFPRGEIRTIRQDTGEIVETRAMTTSERQTEIEVDNG